MIPIRKHRLLSWFIGHHLAPPPPAAPPRGPADDIDGTADRTDLADMLCIEYRDMLTREKLIENITDNDFYVGKMVPELRAKVIEYVRTESRLA